MLGHQEFRTRSVNMRCGGSGENLGSGRCKTVDLRCRACGDCDRGRDVDKEVEPEAPFGEAMGYMAAGDDAVLHGQVHHASKEADRLPI